MILQKQTLSIYNLYSRKFQTTRYIGHFNNVPVEKLTYYPDLEQMYIMVAFKGEDSPSMFTAQVPENLHKVVVAHASKGRRVAFFVDADHNIGHIFFGEESHLEIKRQIDEGFRPAGWANPNSPDWGVWKKKMATWRHVDQGDKEWGFANILHGNPPVLGFKVKDNN